MWSTNNSFHNATALELEFNIKNNLSIRQKKFCDEFSLLDKTLQIQKRRVQSEANISAVNATC